VAVGICTYSVCDSAMKSRSCRSGNRATVTGLRAADTGCPEPPAVAAVAEAGCGVAAAAAAVGSGVAAATAAGLCWGGGAPAVPASDASFGRKVSSAAASRGRGGGDGGGAVCTFRSAHAADHAQLILQGTGAGRQKGIIVSTCRQAFCIGASPLHGCQQPGGKRSWAVGCECALSCCIHMCDRTSGHAVA
jgi:hypothetical protein